MRPAHWDLPSDNGLDDFRRALVNDSTVFRVLQCVAVCCSVFQCVAVCRSACE